MTARIIAAVPGYDNAHIESLTVALEHAESVSALIRSIEGSLAYDTLVAAGDRLWGDRGYQTARLLQGEVRAPRFVMLGVGSPFSTGGGIASRSEF